MKTVLIVIVSVLIIAHAGAVDNVLPEEEDYNAQAEGGTISSITIIPPKRTKVQYIQRVLNINEDDVYTKDLHTQAYIRLWKTDLFYSIRIVADVVEGTRNVALTVEVQDKWTLYPIPILAFNDSEIEGGVAVVERNVFGFGKTIVASGYYGTKRFFFHLIYIDPHVFWSNFSLFYVNFIGISQYNDTVYGTAAVYNEQQADRVNTIIRKSQGLLYSSYVRIGHPFPNNLEPFIRVGFALFENSIFIDKEYDTTDNTIPSSWHIPINLGLAYDILKPYGVQNKGLALEIEYSLPLYSTIQIYHLLYGKAQYSLGLDKREINLFTFYVDGAYGNTPLLHRSGFGGSYTSRSISRNSIRTNKVIAGAFEHSITVFRNNIGGIITGYGGDISLYEVSEYDAIDDPILNGGVFVNFGFVLNQIAIPIAKINLAYNIAAQYMTFSFSLGSVY